MSSMSISNIVKNWDLIKQYEKNLISVKIFLVWWYYLQWLMQKLTCCFSWTFPPLLSPLIWGTCFSVFQSLFCLYMPALGCLDYLFGFKSQDFQICYSIYHILNWAHYLPSLNLFNIFFFAVHKWHHNPHVQVR